MTDLPAQPNKKHHKGILFVVLLVFVLGAFYFVPDRGNNFQEQFAIQNLDSFFFSFQSLVRGDIVSAVEYLVAGIPVLAIFLILFSLSHFVLSGALKSLFRKKKHATVLSVVIAIYAVTNHRIYNYMSNLNAYAIGFLVFCTLLIFLWGLSKNGAQSVRDTYREGEPARKRNNMTRNELRELRKQLREMS